MAVSLKDLYRKYGRPVGNLFNQFSQGGNRFLTRATAPVARVTNPAARFAEQNILSPIGQDVRNYARGVGYAFNPRNVLPAVRYTLNPSAENAQRLLNRPAPPVTPRQVLSGTATTASLLLPALRVPKAIATATPLVRLLGSSAIRGLEAAGYGATQEAIQGRPVREIVRNIPRNIGFGAAGNVILSPRLTYRAIREIPSAVRETRAATEAMARPGYAPGFAKVPGKEKPYYWFRFDDNKFVPAQNAKQVDVGYGVDAFIHKNPLGKGWQIVESKTGNVIGEWSSSSRQRAIESAKEMLEKNKGAIETTINERIAKYGQSPRYAKIELKPPVVAGEKAGQTLARPKSTLLVPKQGSSLGKTTTPLQPLQVPAKAVSSPPSISKKPRKFLQTVQKSPLTTPGLTEKVRAIRPQDYDVFPNKQAIAEADTIIKRSPDEAYSFITGIEPPSATKSAAAIRLSKYYEQQKNLDKAVEVIENYDRQLRESGRFVQAASLWNKLSPEAMVRSANRVAEKYKAVLSPEFKKSIVARMTEIQKLPEGPERNQATIDVLQDIAKQLPLRPGEIFDAYRYQNMLSNPRTFLGRNPYSNLFNTLITRPLDLFNAAAADIALHPTNPLARTVSFSDVPKHYQSLFKGLPDAINAFSQAYKSGSAFERIDITRGDTAIEALRRANAPRYLTVIPRFMEATDRFFQSLLGGAEKTRLLARGVDEAMATSKALEVAKEYLYRTKLGEAKGKAYLTQALDGLGNFALKGRKISVIGKAFEWYVPFVTTPINAAKVMVERTPLGLIGSKANLTAQQIGKAMSGSILLAYGATLAANDRVTWNAPTDAKAKELFYASGRKPYSVFVNGKWTPIWYFGPFALALAMPAAVKNYQEDSKTALTDDQFTKLARAVGDTSKILISQTPLSGVGTFFQMLEGDTSINLGSQLGFTVGQIIPVQGLIRYINTILDPVYRKAQGFTETIKKDTPLLSKQLPAYTTPLGEESRRNLSDYLWPYTMGIPQGQFEQPFQARQQQLQTNNLLNQMNKELERGNKPTLPSGSEISPGVFQLPNNKFAYQLGDEFKQADTPQEATLAIEKDTFKKSNKNFSLSSDGQTVFRRSKDGDVSSMPKLQYDYSLNTNKMQKAKANNDFKTWLNIANEQLAILYQQLQDTTLDELEISNLEEKVSKLIDDTQKYQSYGGFKKGSARKARMSASAIRKLQAKTTFPRFTIRKTTAKTTLKRVGLRRPKAKFSQFAVSSATPNLFKPRYTSKIRVKGAVV